MLKDLGARLACQYRIKIGGLSPQKRLKQGKSKNSQDPNDYWQPPVKWDHFKVCKNERDAQGNFVVAQEIMAKYGEKPTAINVILFSDNLRDVYNDFRAMYKGRKCQCRSEDGEIARWNTDLAPVPQSFEKKNQDGRHALIKCPGDECHFTKQQQCKINVLLRCMIAEAPSLGGAAEFRATSVNSALQIRGSLALLHKLTGGHISGIPLQLSLQPRSTEKGVVYVVHLSYDSDVISLKQKALEYATSAHEADTKLIELVSVEGYEETAEEIEGVVKEYYPEAVEAEATKPEPPPEPASHPAGKPEGATEFLPVEPKEFLKLHQKGMEDLLKSTHFLSRLLRSSDEVTTQFAGKYKNIFKQALNWQTIKDAVEKSGPPGWGHKTASEQTAPPGEREATQGEQKPPIEDLFEANDEATGTEAEAVKIPDCPKMGQTVLVDFCHKMCNERGTCQAYIKIMGEEDGPPDYATHEPQDAQAQPPATDTHQHQELDLFG